MPSISSVRQTITTPLAILNLDRGKTNFEVDRFFAVDNERSSPNSLNTGRIGFNPVSRKLDALIRIRIY